MGETSLEFLYQVSLFPLFLQFLIMIPIFLILSISIFYVSRLLDIWMYSSKKDYYETSYDPITYKKMLLRSLFCTFCMMGAYLISTP